MDQRNERHRSNVHWTTLNSLLLLIVVILGVLATWWWVSSDRTTERNEFVRTVLTAVGAAALILQLRYTHESTRATSRTLELTEQGQVTDRFYKAVEQLAYDTTDVRMGALYALERISEDSDRDYHQVMSIVSAYVRQRAKIHPDERVEGLPPVGHRLGEDIQTALTILARRKKTYPAQERVPVDLSFTDLRGAVFTDASFVGANFRSCLLSDARFYGGTCEGANFSQVYAFKAMFVRTLLKEADFTRARLPNTLLTDFSVSDLADGPAPQVEFLDGADFWDADLTDTVIHVSDLSKTKGLRKVQLEEAAVPGNIPMPTDSITWNLSMGDSYPT